MPKPAATNLFDQLVEVLAEQGRHEPTPVVPGAIFAALAKPAPRARRSPPKSAAVPRTVAKASGAPLVASPRPELASLGLVELERLAAACTRCPLHAGRTHPVFADGSPTAELMFIGEGPGAEEDRQGKPFVGRAGQLLTKMILAMQFRREEVYIANIVKCRPPDNRVPAEAEAAACLPYLMRQIELVRPRVIVMLGATATELLLGRRGISKLRGQWLEYHGTRAMPTFHPAYLLRSPSHKKDAWEDLKQVMHFLGRELPPGAS